MNETDVTPDRPPSTSQLAGAMAQVIGEVGAIPLDGKGAHNVRYSTVNAMRKALNPLLAEEGLYLAVVHQELAFMEKGVLLTRVHQIKHAASGETEVATYHWWIDRQQNMDQAVLGACTTGQRYYLRDTFQLVCGVTDQAPEHRIERGNSKQSGPPPRKEANDLYDRARSLFMRLPEVEREHPNGKETKLHFAKRTNDLPNFIKWATEWFEDMHSNRTQQPERQDMHERPAPVDVADMADEAFA